MQRMGLAIVWGLSLYRKGSIASACVCACARVCVIMLRGHKQHTIRTQRHSQRTIVLGQTTNHSYSKTNTDMTHHSTQAHNRLTIRTQTHAHATHHCTQIWKRPALRRQACTTYHCFQRRKRRTSPTQRHT